MTEETRDVWGKQMEFILTLVGYAVGLGNVWRFPYLCFKNGGGAFLIPYVVCLILLGIPMFALECAFGQYGGKGPLSIWSVNPLFKGLGVSMVLCSTFVFIYYNVVIATAARYLIASFTSDLPWLECKTCDCLTYGKNFTEAEVENMKTNNTLGFNCPNLTTAVNASRSPSEIYYFDEILDDTGSMEELGEIRWELMLCNLVCYIIIFLVLVKGITSLGKVVYITATFPYILLTILLVRSAMLDGAGTGVEYYLKPDWSRLADGGVWSDAATQIFFSLSACMGGLIAMSSYNRFDNNIIRDAFVVPVINCLTSFYSGFVVFCVLGYMADLKGVPIEDVTKPGTGLVYVVYPEAIGAMPVSTLWAILFFFMLCILGFSTQFSAAETIMTSVIDEFPTVFKTKKKQIAVRFAIVLMGFVLGIPMTTQGGTHLLELVDGAVLGFPMLLIGLFEYIVIIYIYGYGRFSSDIEAMVGYKPFKYFTMTWTVVSPILLVAVVTFKAYEIEDFNPAWKGLLYYLIVIFVLMWIPVGFFYYGSESLSKAMAPEEYWINRKRNSKHFPGYQGDIEMPEITTSNNSKSVNDSGGQANKGYISEYQKPVANAPMY